MRPFSRLDVSRFQLVQNMKAMPSYLDHSRRLLQLEELNNSGVFESESLSFAKFFMLPVSQSRSHLLIE